VIREPAFHGGLTVGYKRAVPAMWQYGSGEEQAVPPYGVFFVAGGTTTDCKVLAARGAARV